METELLDANRIRNALEQRKLVYQSLESFEGLLIYHQQWFSQPCMSKSIAVKPEAATLDAKGYDLPLDKLQALASQSKVKEIAAKADQIVKGDRHLFAVDRYIYCFDTKAPPADWADVLPDLIALHDSKAGFLLVDIGLPTTSKDSKSFMFMIGFVEEEWAHYLKWALEDTMQVSCYVMNPKEECALLGADRLISISIPEGVRQFRKFPSTEPATLFWNFMQPVNQRLTEKVRNSCVILSIIDHLPGRRTFIPHLVAKILRNRHKPNDPTSKTKGLNYYQPAKESLRIERDESQRALFIKGIQTKMPTKYGSLKELLKLPLNDLRVKYYTLYPELLSMNSEKEKEKEKETEKPQLHTKPPPLLRFLNPPLPSTNNLSKFDNNNDSEIPIAPPL